MPRPIMFQIVSASSVHEVRVLELKLHWFFIFQATTQLLLLPTFDLCIHILNYI